MFNVKEKYNTLDDDSTLTASLLQSDHGTGSQFLEHSTEKSANVYPKAPAAVTGRPAVSVVSLAAPPYVAPTTEVTPLPSYDSLSSLARENVRCFTCCACSTMNNVPNHANKARCGVCNSINDFTYGSTVQPAPVPSTPSSVRPSFKIVACTTCTAHNKIPVTTPAGAKLKCSICETVSGDFREVGTAPAPAVSTTTTDKIVICSGCSTRNKVPPGTPSHARIRCPVCSTVNDIETDVSHHASAPARVVSTVNPTTTQTSVSSLPSTIVCTECKSMNQLHPGTLPNTKVRCGVCSTVNTVTAATAAASGVNSVVMPPGRAPITPSNIRVVCGKCNTKNSLPSCAPGSAIPDRLKCGQCGQINLVLISGGGATPVPPGFRAKRTGIDAWIKGAY